MIHRGGHPQRALLRGVHEHGAGVAIRELLRVQRRAQVRRRPGVDVDVGHGLVGDKLRLHDQPDGVDQRLHLIQRPR